MKPITMIISGCIAVLVGIVMFGVALSQLTTNINLVGNTYTQAMFPGLPPVMGVFGLVIFITLIGAGLALIGGGAYRKIKETKAGASGDNKSRRSSGDNKSRR
jgi:hypothetical protein